MKDTYKYLLVSEGPTDIAFLKQLISKLGTDLGCIAEVVELSPQKDATSGKWPAHGWTGVKTWCNSWKVKTDSDLEKIPEHFVELAKRRNWKSLVAASAADGLIIQMDTDIAEYIRGLSCDFPEFTGSRREFCQSAIFFWLGESSEVTDKPFLLLPSFAMETWLLATHSPGSSAFDDLDKPFNYEEIIDLEQRLISLGYSSKAKKGIQRLTKKEGDYIGYADTVHSQFSNVISRCEEADHLDRFLKDEMASSTMNAT